MANDCIPYFEPGDRITGRATTAIEGKRFVIISAAPDPADSLFRFARCGAGAKADGVCVWDVASGATDVPIISAGSGMPVPVTSGAAVTAGQEVESDASGRAIPLAAGRAVGKAYSTVGGAGLDLAVRIYP